jgi:hypothetical protein
MCTTPGCQECLPDCAKAERNRWGEMLEALTGTYDDYSCTRLDRTADNGATFDLGYFLPNYVTHGTQQADGVLDRYRNTLRFGLATFDSWDTYVGATPLVAMSDFDENMSESVDGLWSYSPEHAVDSALRRTDGTRIGSIRYPNTTTEYFMDTGIRGPKATQGGLIAASAPAQSAFSPADVQAINDQIQQSLLRVTPYGGTPISAALDDLYWYLGRGSELSVEREHNARPYVVLLTDGYPDDDYRSFGCDCAKTGDPASKDYCKGVSDPTQLHCPYPVAEDAARTLRCGEGTDCTAATGPAERLYVIGYAIDDSDVTDRLNAIAAAGGAKHARFASDASSLRAELSQVLDEISAAR